MRFSFPPHLHRYCPGDFTAFDILVRLIRMPQLWHSRTYLTVSRFRSGPLSSSSSWTVLSMGIQTLHLPLRRMAFPTVFHDFCIRDKYAAAREPESDVAAPAAPAGPPDASTA